MLMQRSVFSAVFNFGNIIIFQSRLAYSLPLRRMMSYRIPET